MENYNYYSSNYDDDSRILPQNKIEEIAVELSREITQEIDKQFKEALK